MKILLISTAFLCLSFVLHAQNEYTMDFVMVSTSDGLSDSTYLHFARAPKKIAATSKKAGTEYSERFVVDSIAGRMLEMYNEEGDKQAIIKPSKTENDKPAEFPLTDVQGLLSMPISNKSEYKLTTGVKVIQGVECQKIILLMNGEEIGTGWVDKSYRLSIGKGNGLFLTPEGMALEIISKIDGIQFHWLCTNIQSGPLDSKEFSFDVPDDYELVKRLK